MFQKTPLLLAKVIAKMEAGQMTLHNPFLNTEFFGDLYFNIISLFNMSWNISDTYCFLFLWENL